NNGGVAIGVHLGHWPVCLLMLDVTDGVVDAETYVLPLAADADDEAERVLAQSPRAAISWIEGADGRTLIYDGLSDDRFASALLDAVTRRRRLRGTFGTVVAQPAEPFPNLRDRRDLEPRLSSSEQSNNIVVFGGRLLLQDYRR